MAKKYNCEKNGRQYFRIKRIVNGKEREFYGDGEKDAVRKYEEYMGKINQGIDVESTDIKFKDGLRHWLYNVKRFQRLKENSYARYESIYRTYLTPCPVIEDMKVSDIRKAHAEKFVAHLKDAGMLPSQIEGCVKVIKMYFEYLLDDDVIGKNPFRKMRLPKNTNEANKIEVYEEQEQKALIQESRSTRNGFIIELCFASGLREGELLALDYSDFYDGGVHITKTWTHTTIVVSEAERRRESLITSPKSRSGIRFVPLPDYIFTQLKVHQKEQIESLGGIISPHVFTSKTGRRLDKSNMTRMYRRACERAAIPYRKFHTLRHTYITNCIEAGIDLPTVQELAGHSSIEQTRQYVHVRNTHKKKAITLLFSPIENQSGKKVGNIKN